MSYGHECAGQISNYCSTAAPTLANADTPTANRKVFDKTPFTCNDGYSTSDTSSNKSPYYQCLPGTTTTGTWSNVVYSCVGTRAHFISLY